MLRQEDVYMSSCDNIISLIQKANKGNKDAISILNTAAEYFSLFNQDIEQFKFVYGESKHYNDYVRAIEGLNIIVADNEKFLSLIQDIRFDIKSTYFSTSIASYLEVNTQFQKYHNPRSAHGFAAEDANALNDVLHGKTVEKIGLLNEKNGADRIADGIKIQTKYYATAQDSVNSAFSRETGLYRYPGQVLEVPADQYEKSVQYMREHIKSGHVYDANGNLITNPDEATTLVQKGSVTYEQAKNIAKSGTIDSLVFDVKNQCITSSCVFGISFVFSYAHGIYRGKASSDALKDAVFAGLQSAASTALVGIITSQVLRTRAAASGTVIMRSGLKFVAKTSVGKSAIEAIANISRASSSQIYGAAAVNHVAKMLRSNVATAVIATAITTAPDFYRAAIEKNISWGQFTKNLLVNIAGMAGGAGGWVAGAAAGAVLGSWIPVIGTAVGGTIGGIAGALTGGAVAGSAAKSVADSIRKDDAVLMIEILQEEAEKVAFDYMLLEGEVERYSDIIQKTVTPAWLRDMYASGDSDSTRRSFANRFLADECELIVSSRKRIVLPKNSQLEGCIPTIYIDEIKRLDEQEYLSKLSPYDPRLKIHKIKQYFISLKNKSTEDACCEIAGGIIGLGIIYFALKWLYGYFPKVTICIIILCLLGLYFGDEDKK